MVGESSPHCGSSKFLFIIETCYTVSCYLITLLYDSLIFRYDLNPITVRYHESRPPLYHFLTTICAIVGGTFTVAGIIDSCIFSATEIFKKFELGKIN